MNTHSHTVRPTVDLAGDLAEGLAIYLRSETFDQWAARHTRGVAFLLHLDRPHHGRTHLTGWTTNLDALIADYRAGHGTDPAAAAVRAGIGFDLARTWPGTRGRQRRLASRGGLARCCPSCGVAPRPARPVAPCRLCADTGRVRMIPPPLWAPIGPDPEVMPAGPCPLCPAGERCTAAVLAHAARVGLAAVGGRRSGDR